MQLQHAPRIGIPEHDFRTSTSAAYFTFTTDYTHLGQGFKVRWLACRQVALLSRQGVDYRRLSSRRTIPSHEWEELSPYGVRSFLSQFTGTKYQGDD